MLEISSPEAIAFKPIKEEVVKAQEKYNTYYVTGPDEIMCLNSSLNAVTLPEKFKVHGGEFWASTKAVRRFVEGLKALGIRPEIDVELDYGQSYFFGFWFDVSTPDTAAYYWIGTRVKEDVLPVICARHLTDAVIANVKALDEMFYSMIVNNKPRTRRA